MKLRQSIFLLVSLAMIAALVACGGTSTSTTTPPPTPTPITVTLSGVPTSLTTNATAMFSATTNDTAGVTWTVTCGSTGACGGFAPTTSLSTVQTTYTAPAAVPSGTTVTITATSVTSTTVTATGTITITAPAGPALADGTYVYSLGGTDKSPSPYFVAGAFVVSGGLITAGEQDYADFTLDNHDAINPTGSALATTSDGNLQIKLALCSGTNCSAGDTAIGVAGVETLNGSMISATSGRIVEFDTSAASSGTLDLQTSTAMPSGGYAFEVHGINSGQTGLAIGGIINVDGLGTISGAGSIFDMNRQGTLFPNEALANTSTVSTPDTSGRALFTLTPSDTSIPQFELVAYVVDAAHIRLVEPTDQLGGTTGGTALSQNTANLAFVLGDSYVVGLTGGDRNGVFQAAALLTASSSTALAGTISYNDLTEIASANALTGGTYVANSTGQVVMTGITDGTLTFDINLYLDGNGNALSIDMDTTDVLAGLGFQQTGTFTAGSLNGAYVMDASGADKTNQNEFDAVGPVTADGVSALTATADVDLNWLQTASAAVPFAGLTVTGTFTAASNGVFTGNIKGLDVTTATNSDAFTYYLVDTTRFFAIETDTNQLTLGYFELQ